MKRSYCETCVWWEEWLPGIDPEYFVTYNKPDDRVVYCRDIGLGDWTQTPQGWCHCYPDIKRKAADDFCRFHEEEDYESNR